MLGFIGINIYYKNKKYDGQIFFMIFGWYGLGRMMIEGLRTDSLYLFGTSIRVSQALAAVLFVTCTALLIYFEIKKPKRPLYTRVPAQAGVAEVESTTKVESDLNIAVISDSNEENETEENSNSEE